MAKNYARNAGFVSNAVSISTPQTTKAREDQVKNNAGGFVFQVSPMDRLRRFLVLGCETNTYYTSAKKLSTENAKNIIELLKNEKTAKEAVDEIVSFSKEGRIAKNDTAIFALALAANSDSKDTRSYALLHLNDVCRTFTHLATFLTYLQSMKASKGWGRGIRNAIAYWYNSKAAKDVAYQVVKYGSRRVEGELPWSHRDVLRKAHVNPLTQRHGLAFRYAVMGVSDEKAYYLHDHSQNPYKLKNNQPISTRDFEEFRQDDDLKIIYGTEKAKNASSVAELAKAIEKYDLPMECVPKEMLNNKEIYDVLVRNMNITATIRNLGKMTQIGTLVPLGMNTAIVVDRITNEENLHKGRVHPVSLLGALKTYGSGHGFKGQNSWTPISQITDALEDAYYKSFKYVEPTNKNILLAVDVSGSMSWGNVCGMQNLTPAEGAAAMAMTIAKTEKNHYIYGFADQFRDLGITSKDSMKDVLAKTSAMSFGGTNCALPMAHALKNKMNVDAFVVITDNETWFDSGEGHPFEALKEYRRKMNKPNAKLIVIAMEASNFTIADPNDEGMMDVAGFDANAPIVIADFIRGKM